MSGSTPAADPLDDLADRLATLDSAPVAEHPQVLEDVHRGLVAALDALASAVGSGAART